MSNSRASKRFVGLFVASLNDNWRRRPPSDVHFFETVKAEQHIRSYFQTLYDVWGPQHWWPARSCFEVIVGAYLTQNTSWSNVERVLERLRKAQVLSVRGIRRTPLPKLEELIRSAGYFRQKAQSLKTFVGFLDNRYRGSLARMFPQPTEKLREELLALSGVGPETADSILLYAGNLLFLSSMAIHDGFWSGTS